MSKVKAVPKSRPGRSEPPKLPNWDEVHDIIQRTLADLDLSVRSACPDVVVSAGRNSSPTCYLFSYRTYSLGEDIGTDPIVVGVSFTVVSGGTLIRGDIAAETLGDVLFETPPQEVTEKGYMFEAVREVAEQLGRQGTIVSAALQSERRLH